MIKTILLDLDGPLLDGKCRHYQCYADILYRHGYDPMPIETYWEMKRLRSSRQEQLAMSGAESIYDLFLKEWLSHIEMEEYLALDRVQDGALEMLQAWRNQEINLVLVTMRSHREQLIHQLQATDLLKFFSSVIDCKHDQGGKGKAREVVRLLPALSGSECIWIGDTEADYEASRHFGCPVCLLTCGLRTKEYLASLNPEFLKDGLMDVKLDDVMNYVS